MPITSHLPRASYPVFGAPSRKDLSPESLARDQREKLHLYEQAGVLEYWIVHPVDKTVSIFRRGQDNLYGKPQLYTSEERVPVGVLPELEIDLAMVFAE